jgi:hypothetical protein
MRLLSVNYFQSKFNISVISQQSVLLVEETGVSGENLHFKIQDEDNSYKAIVRYKEGTLSYEHY